MSQYMGPQGRAGTRDTADRLKHRFLWLQSFSDDELRQITYCVPGETMSSEEQYFDISNPERGVIQGEQGVAIPPDSCYVPRSEISRSLWDKLTARFS